jgi:tight adherence protein C
MTAAVVAAVPLGMLLGLGLWTLVSLVPRLSRPRLSSRVVPYIVDVSPEAREFVARRPADPAPLVIALARPAFAAARGGADRLLGGGASIAARQRQAGIPIDVDGFRARQLAATGAGAALGVAAAILAARIGTAPPPALVGLGVLGAALGLLLPEQLLRRRAAARRHRLREQLPTVLELLALSLSAGEGLFDAVRRIARAGSGELSDELRGVVADVHAGSTLAAALVEGLGPLGVAPIDRLVEQLATALDRGAAVAEVLRAQAQDARDDARRELLEAAGRKEIAMLVPLVFLILPVTVAFAILPGVLVLQLGF